MQAVQPKSFPVVLLTLLILYSPKLGITTRPEHRNRKTVTDVSLTVLYLRAELENHLGIGDKTLAEFIIQLSAGQTTPQGFQAVLEKNGAELPLSFCSTLLNLIRTMRPGGQTASVKAAPTAASGASEKTVKYPGLAVPDNPDYVKKMTEDLVASAVARGPRYAIAARP